MRPLQCLFRISKASCDRETICGRPFLVSSLGRCKLRREKSIISLVIDLISPVLSPVRRINRRASSEISSHCDVWKISKYLESCSSDAKKCFAFSLFRGIFAAGLWLTILLSMPKLNILEKQLAILLAVVG